MDWEETGWLTVAAGLNGPLFFTMISQITQVLVDGPSSGVARQVIPLKRVSLTDIKARVPRNARAKTLNKAWEVRVVGIRWECWQGIGGACV